MLCEVPVTLSWSTCESAGALDIAAAGTQGFALYDRRTSKWRLFGDVGQERAFVALHLGWLSDVVAVCRESLPRPGAKATQGKECSLVLHSRFFLDEQTIMAQRPLHQVRWPPGHALWALRWWAVCRHA